MKRFTKEELLQEIAAGNRTIKGLADKFGLSRDSMKSALTKLGINLTVVREEMKQLPIIMDNSPASDEDEWKKLYNDYDLEGIIGTQAQLMIAQCKINYGMTPAQARQYMKDNFDYQIIVVKFKKKGDK